MVILTENLAIKIGLPFNGAMRLALIIARNILTGQVIQKFKRHHGHITQMAKNVTRSSGLEANRREIRISREHPEYRIAPVLRHYLWGLIIVMPRGEPVNAPQPWGNTFSLLPHFGESDLLRAANTCRFADGLRVIDYACPQAEEILPLLST